MVLVKRGQDFDRRLGELGTSVSQSYRGRAAKESRTLRAIASILVFHWSRLSCFPDLATGNPFWLLMMAIRQLKTTSSMRLSASAQAAGPSCAGFTHPLSCKAFSWPGTAVDQNLQSASSRGNFDPEDVEMSVPSRSKKATLARAAAAAGVATAATAAAELGAGVGGMAAVAC